MDIMKRDDCMNSFRIHKTGYKNEWMVVYFKDGRIDYQHRGTKGRGVKFFYTRRDAMRSGNTWVKKGRDINS